MDQYANFARVYDLFMENVPYKKWANEIVDILHSENITAYLFFFYYSAG